MRLISNDIRRALRAVVVAAVLASGTALVNGTTHAADPTPPLRPTASSRPPTCAERFPAEGPGGVDLQLGCVVGELVGFYGSVGTGEPPRLSTILLPVAVAGAAIAVALALVRRGRAAAGRRLAAAAPTTWWSCPACRSLNAAGRSACYRCGRAIEPGVVELRADAEPPAGQSFGKRQDRP